MEEESLLPPYTAAERSRELHQANRLLRWRAARAQSRHKQLRVKTVHLMHRLRTSLLSLRSRIRGMQHGGAKQVKVDVR